MYIYGLCCDDDVVRYIGASINPLGRLIQHISEAKYKKSDKDLWITDILSEKKYPHLVILDVVNQENAIEKEKEWIKNHKGLVNGTMEKSLRKRKNTYKLQYGVLPIAKNKVTISSVASLMKISRQRVHQILKEKKIVPEKISAPSSTGYIYLLSQDQVKTIRSLN